MKLSIHTTVTDPEKWLYPWRESIASFCDVADQVVVVDGSESNDVARWCTEYEQATGQTNKIRVIKLPWPWEYTQGEFPKHLNAGLNECDGDWVIKADIDYIFHENQINDLRVRLRGWNNEQWLAACLDKFLVINKSRGYRKAKMPFVIHKKIAGDAIQYGIQSDIDPALDDWCYPVIVLRGRFNDEGVPIGTSLPIGAVKNLGVDVWNYDYFFRTEEMAKMFFQRTSRAWRKSVNDNWGENDDDAWRTFVAQTKQRLVKPFVPLELSSHPKYIRDRVAALIPEQYGYDNWGIKS